MSVKRTAARRTIAIVAIAGLLELTLAGRASAAPPADASEDLQARIDALEARVAELSDPAARRMSERRAQEMRALVADMLADADNRAGLLDANATAGWDNGFFVQSADGRFRLDVSGQIQARWIGSFRDDGPGDDSLAGFETTRVRLGLGGHVGDPSWKWFVWSGWTATGRSLLLDAWIRKSFDGGWSLTAGQFKVPIWQEWLISEKRQQLVDRSLLTTRYSSLYGQGVKVSYAADDWRAHFVVCDGVRTWNTPWNTPTGTTTGTLPYQLVNEYALTARAEARLGGTWAGAAEFQSWPGTERMTVLGGAVHYQHGAYGTDDDEIELLQWTLDGSIKLDGANVYAAIIGTHVDDGSTTRDEWGVLVQAGIFLDDDWELTARYEWGDLDGAGTVDDTLSVLTVGVNRFWRRHALKLSADIGYGFEAVDPGWAGAVVGWQADAPGGDGQVVIRSQVQLLF